MNSIWNFILWVAVWSIIAGIWVWRWLHND